MNKNMKITMLGTTGAGKTCYMLGLYSVMQMGVQGFNLSAQDPDVDLRLTDLWDRLIDVTGEDRWPPATANDPQTYAFYFTYALQPLISFDWLDYRGGAMTDNSSAEDTQILRKRLQKSDCVFLCISGEYLQEPANQMQLMSKARKMKVNNMIPYLIELGNIIKPSEQKPYPIVITLTKYDLCAHRRKEVIEDIKTMFAPLFTPNSGWLVMICPVSLGKELAENIASGEIDPKNMHLPLVFAVYAKLREFYLTEQEQRDNQQSVLDQLRSGNWFERWFNSADIDRTSQGIAYQQKQIEELQRKIALLAQELENTPLFLGGKEIQI
ncbi:MAG: hypothetical protein EA365_08875 [Gloeocapsa sp. DLM2.Bin57]|nr:MAG: hypothetical protein EA365_08875 [Gloeocapsa sp. DLM2.Bin57]